MNNKTWTTALGLCAALLWAGYAGVLIGQQTAPAPVKVYHVTNPAAFPPLPLPANGMVFRNGLFQSPGLDYTTSGTQFHFLPGTLQAGDTISIAVPAQTAWSSRSIVLAIDPENPPTGVQWTLTWDVTRIVSLAEIGGPVLANAGRTINCEYSPGSATCLAILPQANPPVTIASGVLASVQAMALDSQALGSLAVSGVVATSPAGSAVNVAITFQ